MCARHTSEAQVVLQRFSQSLLCFLLADHLSLDEVGIGLEDLFLVGPGVLMHAQGLVHLHSLQVEVCNDVRLGQKDIFSGKFDRKAKKLEG